MDRDYRREAMKYRKENNLPEDTELKQQHYPDFPIETARLRSVYLLAAFFVVATAVYGFAVEWHIAIPLTLQFISTFAFKLLRSTSFILTTMTAAFTATAIFNINSTLVIDLYPSKPASATAINNLVRCTLGSIGVGFVERGIADIDEMPVFLTLAGLAALSTSLVVVEKKWGPGWRMERITRLKALAEREAIEWRRERGDI
jgi:hypothetical protein